MLKKRLLSMKIQSAADSFSVGCGQCLPILLSCPPCDGENINMASKAVNERSYNLLEHHTHPETFNGILDVVSSVPDDAIPIVVSEGIFIAQ